MTEKLKTLLHEQVETVDFAVPDVAALTRAGDRRMRRRRALVGGAAALAVVGALAASRILGGPATDSTPVVSEPNGPQQVTWAAGRVIHDGNRTVDVGLEVNAFVRTGAGFVFADPTGRVHSVVDGRVSAVGRTDAKDPHLVADQDGALAGWVDTAGDRPAFVVVDQATGETTRNDDATVAGMGGLADEEDAAFFYAIDGRTAYWRDRRGAVAVDVDSGELRVVDAEARNGFDISDVEDGLIAFHADRGTALGFSRGEVVLLRQVYGTLGALSPGAAYYTSDADEPEVYDARTGERIEFDLDHWFATGYEWLDGHRLAMLAQETKRSPVQLLTCQVPAGTCEVSVADLGSFDDLISDGVQLPIGEPLAD